MSLLQSVMFTNKYTKSQTLFICPNLVAGWLARIQHPEGPTTIHIGTVFFWFPCVYKGILRWFPRPQVANACLSCSPPSRRQAGIATGNEVTKHFMPGSEVTRKQNLVTGSITVTTWYENYLDWYANHPDEYANCLFDLINMQIILIDLINLQIGELMWELFWIS